MYIICNDVTVYKFDLYYTLNETMLQCSDIAQILKRCGDFQHGNHFSYKDD